MPPSNARIASDGPNSPNISCNADAVGPQVVLVHSPLVGPSTWRWVAEELTSGGVDVAVPTLRLEALSADSFDRLVSQAASAVMSDEVVLVGHSGGGILLPFIAEVSACQNAHLVFVDAGLPPPDGRVELASEEFRTFLQSHVDAEGVLAPWHTWWGEQGMQRLVRDEQRREIVASDVPRLPLSYFDADPVVPVNWTSRAASYVLLSETYRTSADQARALGWTVVEELGTHLELVNRPADVADAIVQVTAI